jgi:hypothetical protein
MVQSISLCCFLPELWRQTELSRADVPGEWGYGRHNVVPDQTKLIAASSANEEKCRSVTIVFTFTGLLHMWRHEKSLAIDFPDGTQHDGIRKKTSLNTHDVGGGHEISLQLNAAAWQ